MDFLAKTTDAVTESEIRHAETVRELASECLVLLENNGALPITTPGRIAVYGNGARHTVRGGGGSGEVNTRNNVSICDGLANAGFEITSKGWLDRYDGIYDSSRKAYMDKVESTARERGIPATSVYFEMAFEEPVQPQITEEDIAEASCDTAIFVISRNSSEGRDRKPEKGDYYLTDEEEYNLNFITDNFDKVIVLLNIGGVIDMSRLKHRPGVSSILFVGQIGNQTGDIVADAITGRTNPSGKLVDTWASHYEDYPCAGEFSSLDGDTDDEFYKEGIYVGYRYFDSFGITPAYCFGFGRSYTTFTTEVLSVTQEGNDVSIWVKVFNTGSFPGKEVVQVYFSAPEGPVDRPYQELAGYAKTDIINPGESRNVEVTFPIDNFACFDDRYPARVIPDGDYIIRVGTSSRETSIEAVLNIPEFVVQEKYDRILEDDARYLFEDMKNPGKGKNGAGSVPHTVIKALLRQPDRVGFHLHLHPSLRLNDRLYI